MNDMLDGVPMVRSRVARELGKTLNGKGDIRSSGDCCIHEGTNCGGVGSVGHRRRIVVGGHGNEFDGGIEGPRPQWQE